MILPVHVEPDAQQTCIQKGDGEWVIVLTVPPTEGKANQALGKRLAPPLSRPKLRILRV